MAVRNAPRTPGVDQERIDQKTFRRFFEAHVIEKNDAAGLREIDSTSDDVAAWAYRAKRVVAPKLTLAFEAGLEIRRGRP